MDVFVIARYLGALLVTLALMGAALYAARRFLPQLAGSALAAPAAWGGARAKAARRLRLVETLTLDPRRRLAVVRWADTEYLLLLGAAGEQLVADQAAPPDPLDAAGDNTP